jgi:putative transposase
MTIEKSKKTPPVKTMQRTVRVELESSCELLTILRDTIKIYGQAYSSHAEYFLAQEHTNKKKAHGEHYRRAKEKVPSLPIALLQSARDNASESIKSFNSNYPKKRWRKTPKYRANSWRATSKAVSLRGSLLTFSTVHGRQRQLVTIPDWFVSRYGDWKFQSAVVGVDRRGVAYACLVYSKPLSEAPTVRVSGSIVGLDRGIVNLVYGSDGARVSGKPVRAARRHHLYNRSTLQQKSTPSAKRRLRQQSGREKRFMRQVNHEVSKQLASDKTVSTYVLEDLSSIGAKRKISKMGAERYKHRANKRLSDWSHGQLLEFLTYKCVARGIGLEFVDPSWTSQTCCRCGRRPRGARVGGWFHCSRCGYSAHADLNAAINIRDKFSSDLASGAGHCEVSSLEIDLWGDENSSADVPPSVLAGVERGY